MSILRAITSNYIINVGVFSFVLAQILKALLVLITKRKLSLERLLGAGGMPSSHAALTSSVAVAVAHKEGIASPIFGLAIVLAIVVMYDAMGVRRAAGEHARLLNRLVIDLPQFSLTSKSSNKKDRVKPPPPTYKELKEFLGHTPLEVLGGCILGVLIALLLPTPV